MKCSKRLVVYLAVICLVLFAAGTAVAAGKDAGPAKGEEMTLGQATVLGVVEGLTEYLPVSSTGHLLLAERAMGIGEDPGGSSREKQRDKSAADAFTICIQAGAIVAVLGLYFRRVKQMLAGLAGRDEEGRRMLFNIAAGFLPAAVIGLLFNKAIKAYLFGIWPVVAAWFAGGMAILAVGWWNRREGRPERRSLSLEALSWKMALAIGFAQCIAMWPGVSRSLVTIVGGVMVGLSLPAAVEFSFLLGVVTLGAATGYDALKHGHIMVQTFSPLPIAVGLLFAFLAAVVSVKWMVGYLNRHGLALFGYYRVGLALVVGGMIMAGML
ncbi:MAG: undecaprenyl-diphosphate phosphatase [Desulfuromonadales bacterium]